MNTILYIKLYIIIIITICYVYETESHVLYWVLASKIIIVCIHVCDLTHSSSAMCQVHIIEKMNGAIIPKLVVYGYFVTVVTKLVLYSMHIER